LTPSLGQDTFIPQSTTQQDRRMIAVTPTALKIVKQCSLPLALCHVEAGFPSPADDYMEGALDLNEHVIKHPSATYFVKASGDSMIGAGIFNGDLLIVDRSLEASSGKVVIAEVDGQLTVKRLLKLDDRFSLQSENSSYPPVDLQEGNEVVVWGVVTHVIHDLL
jgi:DNA polymerase V